MLIATIGWLGTFIYLANHAYISFTQEWKKTIYYGANAVAAACLIVSSFFTESWQAIVINGFWLAISLALLANKDISVIKFSRRIFYTVVVMFIASFIAYYLSQAQLNMAILGWLSAFVFSGCYLLFSQEKMLPRYYLCWNAFAAIALMPQLWIDGNWPVFYLEISWAAISVYGAVRKFSQIHLID
ncbi:CBU_0592 family membrane protein [Thalassotalea sp. PLHSN55]|uniref:CBU_0592 family membrane protein n=1 Tax=Thalassotalea sp. PLHSN55 TaxID=3435888 RepID=UPI003F850183